MLTIRDGWMASFNGHEFEQALGDNEGQGGLACCSPWGHKQWDTNERLNNNNEEYKKGKIGGMMSTYYREIWSIPSGSDEALGLRIQDG